MANTAGPLGMFYTSPEDTGKAIIASILGGAAGLGKNVVTKGPKAAMYGVTKFLAEHSNAKQPVEKVIEGVTKKVNVPIGSEEPYAQQLNTFKNAILHKYPEGMLPGDLLSERSAIAQGSGVSPYQNAAKNVLSQILHKAAPQTFLPDVVQNVTPSLKQTLGASLGVGGVGVLYALLRKILGQ